MEFKRGVTLSDANYPQASLVESILAKRCLCTHGRTLCCCCCCSAVKSAKSLILCDPLCCSMPGCTVLHYYPEFAQIHVHGVTDALQSSHLLLPPSPPALNLSQHQGLVQGVGSLHQVAKVLEHQCESATGTHVSSHPGPPSHLPAHPSLWVVPGHQL